MDAAGRYLNTSGHTIDLDDGRVIAHGEWVDIDKSRFSRRERELVESGMLTPEGGGFAKQYDGSTVDDLRSQLADRGLSTTGNKSELIQRLADDDANPTDETDNGGEG